MIASTSRSSCVLVEDTLKRRGNRNKAPGRAMSCNFAKLVIAFFF